MHTDAYTTRSMLSEYLDEIVTTTTHDAYKGVPLATHSSQARGQILERVARRVMENTMGETSSDPPVGVRVNGAKRGRASQNYDFGIAGRRVEVKSAQLKWDNSRTRWVARWQNIKRDEYDDLILVLYTPCGLYIFLHDGIYGVSTNGKAQHSGGGQVMVCGPCNRPISTATDAICAKMAPMHYATMEFSEFEDLVTTTTTHDAYKGVPLATHSPQARGQILEHVARRVMENIMGVKSSDPLSGVGINGRKRGRNKEAYDFMIEGRRVEVKSAQLSWDGYHNYWYAIWPNVKRDEYDDLLLVLYTPYCLHIFLHDNSYGISTHGKSQDSSGGRVQVFGPSNEPLMSVAMDTILKKMEHMHYASLAYS